VRIEKTKRSKNDQKPTRNEKKTKSQEQDKEFNQRSQPDQPDTVKLSQRKKQRSQRPKLQVKGPLLSSVQRLKSLFEVLKSQGLKLLKEQSCFKKKQRSKQQQGVKLPFFKLLLTLAMAGQRYKDDFCQHSILLNKYPAKTQPP
ncbi:hypothetical protein Tco_0644313, partial [Tanacetum coccineum]